MAAPKTNFERKLLTILSADVVGYSRLMAEEEEHTLEVFIGHKKVFEEQVAAHKGRIFNTAGDAILAEFPSAVEGLRCAIAIQEKLWQLNKSLPPAKSLNFRIGLNIGDVMVQGTDLMGDGVNIAARVQTAAMPGGVCLSGSVHDQVQGKLTVPMIFAGEKIYKNIPHPVRTYAVKFEGRSENVPQLGTVLSNKKVEPSRGRGTEILFGLLFLVVGSFVYSTKTSGLQLNNAICMPESSNVPADLVDEALMISPDKVSAMREGLHCTMQMKCYGQWKPWISFALEASNRQLPFAANPLYVANGQNLSAFVSKDHSTFRFRAVRTERDGSMRWSSQECLANASTGTIYPGLQKIFGFFR